jgi:hypothetical protein
MSKPAAIQPVAATKRITALIYAENGVGKTPLIGTSEKALILDADDGTTSAATTGSSAERWFIRDWNDLSEAIDYLAQEGHKQYHWAWLDSITGMEDRGLAQIMEDLVANPRFAHRSKYQPDKGEYGQNMRHVSDNIRILAGLPMNVGITCHPIRWDASDTESEALAEYLYWPSISGKNMIPKICGHFNLIAYMDHRFKDGKEYRVLYTGGRQKFYARDRYKALPARMVNPTIPDIERRIMAKLSGSGPASKPTTPAGRAAAIIQRAKQGATK